MRSSIVSWRTARTSSSSSPLRSDLNEYQLNCNRDAFKGKTVLEFRSFDENYATIKEKLQKLNKDNFIVLTVKEGSQRSRLQGTVSSSCHHLLCACLIR